MNKGELIAALAAKTEMTKKDSETALNAVLDVIAESMAKGEKVQLIGFGTFEAKTRPARVARNPRTGESVKIAACKAPAFKAGKALKDAVNKEYCFTKPRLNKPRFFCCPCSKWLQKRGLCANISILVGVTCVTGGNSYDRKNGQEAYYHMRCADSCRVRCRYGDRDRAEPPGSQRQDGQEGRETDH